MKNLLAVIMAIAIGVVSARLKHPPVPSEPKSTAKTKVAMAQSEETRTVIVSDAQLSAVGLMPKLGSAPQSESTFSEDTTSPRPFLLEQSDLVTQEGKFIPVLRDVPSDPLSVEAIPLKTGNAE